MKKKRRSSNLNRTKQKIGEYLISPKVILPYVFVFLIEHLIDYQLNQLWSVVFPQVT